MASIEYIQKRIISSQQRVDKCTAKMARILKAEASGWEDNPYYYDEADKRYAQRELDAAQEALSRFQQQLIQEQEKAASRNIAPILAFLEGWKRRCLSFYGDSLKEVFDDMAEIKAMEQRAREMRYDDPTREELEKKIRDRRHTHYCELHGYFEPYKEERGGRFYHSNVKVKDGKWEHAAGYVERTLEDSIMKVQKDLDKEADRKYDFIVERVCSIVGEIIDAAGLSIGAKDDLNGIIIGKKGKARVTTIGAGGYNIQCYHFRTLIHKA